MKGIVSVRPDPKHPLTFSWPSKDQISRVGGGMSTTLLLASIHFSPAGP
jgi:hypothetical protein